MISQTNLDAITRRLISKEVWGVAVALAHKNETLISTSGNLDVNSQFFIASSTKLYTTALILQFVDQNKLKLDDTLEGLLTATELNGLHVYRGVDYSRQITIENLLSHTSGLPDYFQARRQSERSFLEHRAWQKPLTNTFAKKSA